MSSKQTNTNSSRLPAVSDTCCIPIMHYVHLTYGRAEVSICVQYRRCHEILCLCCLVRQCPRRQHLDKYDVPVESRLHIFWLIGHVGKWRMPLFRLQPDEEISEGSSIRYGWISFCIHTAWVSRIVEKASVSGAVLFLPFIIFLSLSLTKSSDGRFCSARVVFRGTVYFIALTSA